MVKGISKQVIVVNSPDKDLFDQAIFILSDDVIKRQGVTDQMLLRQAREMIGNHEYMMRTSKGYYILCTLLGAALTAAVWLLTAIL